jgi:hypothetical protein
LKIKVASLIIISILVLSSCGQKQMLEPTYTLPSIFTQTIVKTQSQLFTPLATITPTITETETQTPIPIPTHKPTFTLIPIIEFTNVINYRITVVPTQERSGSCWSSSSVLNRVDAWRCTSGDYIYDPCFSIPGNNQALICDASPYDDRIGFKLILTESLPAITTIPNPISAWVIELADGTKCSYLGGATKDFEGRRVNYSCSDGWYILGDAQQARVWKAQKILIAEDFSTISESIQVSLRIVWK